MNTTIDLKCCICKERAMFIEELQNNKGFKFYCSKHFKNNTDKDAETIRKILERK